MAEFNSETVYKTLRELVGILDKNKIEYRFLGSVVIAAINGRLHRELGDLDLIIDKRGRDILYAELTKLGYVRAGGVFAFGRKYLCLETLEHDRLLGIGYFYGTYLKDGVFLMGGIKTNVTIDKEAIEPTKYRLDGIDFIGIRERAIATGVKNSEKNPKRDKEVQLLTKKKIEPLVNNYIHVNVYGRKCDWIFHMVMGLLNVIGEIRVKLGLAFDPWR